LNLHIFIRNFVSREKTDNMSRRNVAKFQCLR